MIDYSSSIQSTLPRVNNTNFNNTYCHKAKILVVDDHAFSRITAVDLLSLDGYEVLETDDSTTAMDFILQNNPDLILLDFKMPGISGIEVCKQVKQDHRTSGIPVIFMTVTDDRSTYEKCMEAGGDDILPKPLDRMSLSARVKSLVMQKRLNEGLEQTKEVLFSLARAIESRNLESKESNSKLPQLAKAFGEYLELPEEDIEDLIYAAHLHDVGTVGIEDRILFKKGELTAQEREIIRQHVLIGERICEPLHSRKGILPIIRHHHERWNGSGYPDGLMGNEIPYLAQVFQILDIYDALTRERPYKMAFKSSCALEMIDSEGSKGWRNPKLVEQFIAFVRSQNEL